MSSLNNFFKDFDKSMADFAPKDKKEELNELLAGTSYRESTEPLNSKRTEEGQATSQQTEQEHDKNLVVLNDAGRPVVRRSRGEQQLPKGSVKGENEKDNNDNVAKKVNIKLNLKRKEPAIQPEINEHTVKKEENIQKPDDTNMDLERLFELTDTPLSMKNIWMDSIIKAREVQANNLQADKVRRGKFRITEGGKLEILPETETGGKSSRDLCKMQWSI